MFSQEFHHISFEGQCLSVMIFTSRNLRTTKSEQSWLDENIEAFPGHVEYAIGPLACKNSLLVGFATMLAVMPLKKINNTCPFVWCMRILQKIHFHGIIITQSWNFFSKTPYFDVYPKGVPLFGVVRPCSDTNLLWHVHDIADTSCHHAERGLQITGCNQKITGQKHVPPFHYLS